MSTLFEVTAAQFFERTLQIQSVVNEEIDSMEEVMNDYVLVNKKSVVTFKKGQAEVVPFNELPSHVRETILKNHVEVV